VEKKSPPQPGAGGSGAEEEPPRRNQSLPGGKEEPPPPMKTRERDVRGSQGQQDPTKAEQLEEQGVLQARTRQQGETLAARKQRPAPEG
jgi:hypothetical protein